MQTCNLFCKRPGCHHSASRTDVPERIFKLIPIHASVIYQIVWFCWILFPTRMHSSRMRTGRSLSVFPSLMLPGGGGSPCRGGLLPGGILHAGVVCSGGSAPGGCLVWEGVSGPGGFSMPGGSPCWGGSPCSGEWWWCLVRGGFSMPEGSPCPGGFSMPGGVVVSGPGGFSMPGGVVVSGPGGFSLPEPPPVNRMTDRCKNITLAKTSFAAGNKGPM